MVLEFTHLRMRKAMMTQVRKYIHIRWVSVVEFHDPTLGIGKVFGQESTVVK